MITIEHYELESGKSRRVAVDDEAPDNPITAPNDFFRDYSKKAIAFWDVKDVDGVRQGTFLLVRPDLQGQGYMKRLVPFMTELLGNESLEITVRNPKVDTLISELKTEGADVRKLNSST